MSSNLFIWWVCERGEQIINVRIYFAVGAWFEPWGGDEFDPLKSGFFEGIRFVRAEADNGTELTPAELAQAQAYLDSERGDIEEHEVAMTELHDV